MANTEALKELQAKSVPDITAELPKLDRLDLSELMALEADTEAPRVTLTKAIADEIAKRDEDPAPPATAQAAPAPKAPPVKDHTHPDYDGPLTIEQSLWRHHNLKPAGVVAKK